MNINTTPRAAMRTLRPVIWRPTRTTRSLSSTAIRASTVDLAYTRHDPPTPPTKQHPTMIIMHGLFGSQRNNRTLSKVLAKSLSRPIYTIDLRNHGASPHTPNHTYTAMSEDVESFLTQHNIHRPILLGHSMGAKVAMTLALRRPQSYSGVVPVDNSPVDAALKSDFGTYLRGMQEIESQTSPPITKQSAADEILAKYEPSLPIRQFLLTNLIKDDSPTGAAVEDGRGRTQPRLKFRVPLGTLAKALPDMSDFPFKDPDTNRFEGPVLVIRGGESRYVADECLPVMGRFFPRFELADMPGAGHWVLSEKFEDCVRVIVDWVGRCVDPEEEGR